MTMLKRSGYVFLAALFGALALGLSEHGPSVTTDGIVSAAQAVVGRPLTPVSVAGVARRTARRCAYGVYNC
jgi:hypothetical protein